MLLSLFLATLLSPTVVAQNLPAAPTAVLNNGPCLDSPRAVPHVLQPPVVRSTQVVGIAKVTSTATMTQGEVIGFLYTLEDGTTWLGQRTAQYMSPSDAQQINAVLASTHMPDATVKEFPPQRKYGVKTNYLQFFQVKIPPTALDALRVRLDPCIAWPTGTSLPDPSL